MKNVKNQIKWEKSQNHNFLKSSKSHSKSQKSYKMGKIPKSKFRKIVKKVIQNFKNHVKWETNQIKIP